MRHSACLPVDSRRTNGRSIEGPGAALIRAIDMAFLVSCEGDRPTQNELKEPRELSEFFLLQKVSFA